MSNSESCGRVAANSLYPRGRHAYAPTPTARIAIERLVWPGGHSDRTPRLPASGAIHQLATLDLLASFIAMAEPQVPVGLLAWVPERAAGVYLGGYVRPDAIALVRVRDRLVTLLVERDLGTENADVLADKIRRYRAYFGGRPNAVVTLAFVVASARRALTVRRLAEAGRAASPGLHVAAADVASVIGVPIADALTTLEVSDGGGEAPLDAAIAAIPVLAPCFLELPDAFGWSSERHALIRSALAGERHSPLGGR